MGGELSANEVSKLVQELKSLDRKFGGKDGLINHLLQISENLNHQHQDIYNSQKELEDLFQKLQDSKNLKLEVESLKLDIASKKDVEEINKLIKYITNFRTLMIQKTDEINSAYIKLNRHWLEEDEVLKTIEKLEKSFLITILFGGIGLGILLTITIIVIARYFL